MTASKKKESQRLTPKQFLVTDYYPADEATERAVEALRIELGLQNRDSSRGAVSSFLVACRGLLWRGDTLSELSRDILGFPHDKAAFGGPHATYTRMRIALIKLGYIALERKGSKDIETGENSVCLYKVLRYPDDSHKQLRFVHRPPERFLTVRQHKTRFGLTTDDKDDGKVLTQKECSKKFGTVYDVQELRLRGLSNYLQQHPLIISGTVYSGFSRKFNDGRLDRGGRIYAGYSSLKKKQVNPETGEIVYPRSTATIDGEKVALIDISASFLCVRAGMAGTSVPNDEDQYARLPFVVDKDSRAFAKVLVSAMIANGGTKKRYSPEMREKFPDVIGDHKISAFTGAIFQTFPFLQAEAEADGLEVVFIESEIVLRTVERCMVAGVPVWPLHDAIFVRLSQVEQAKQILIEEFTKSLGFPPRLKVNSTLREES